jgi:hypothetical protein
VHRYLRTNSVVPREAQGQGPRGDAGRHRGPGPFGQ